MNNNSIALNVLFVSYNSEEITLAYKSEYNFMLENQVILLMINDGAERCYYFTVKKAAIFNGDNCFQNSLNDATKYQNIKKDPQRISKIKPYISQYNWKDIEFPSHQKDWKKFEQNNKTIALNMSFLPHNTKTIRHVYKSKYNHKLKNQVILLLITDGKK